MRCPTIHECDRLIDQHRQAIISVARQRNSLTPIRRLPTELLARIFQLAVVDCDLPAPADFDSSDPNAIDTLLSVIRLSHVCSHWREVAINFAPLWSTIVFCCPCWTGLLLQRAKNALLTVYADSRDTIMTESLSLLFKRTDRIRTVHVELPRDTLEQFIVKLESRCAPSLESLTLISRSRHSTGYSPCLVDLHAPRLRHMKLDKIAFGGWDSPIFDFLCSLEIRNLPTKARPTLSQLLGALKNARSLSSLILMDVLPKARDDSALGEHGLQVSLPRLTTLGMSATTSTCIDFFQHLSLPSELSLYIPKPEDLPSEVEGLHATFFACAGVPGRHVTITINESLCDNLALSDSGQLARQLIIRAGSSSTLFDDARQVKLLRTTWRVVPPSDLYSLRVDCKAPISSRAWSTGLASATQIHTVSVDGRCALGLFEALTPDGISVVESQQSASDAEQSDVADLDEAKGRVVLPKLRDLTVSWIDFRWALHDSDVVDLLTRALRAREASGLPRLRSLSIVYCAKVRETMVSKLRKYTKAIKWDGRKSDVPRRMPSEIV